MAEDLEKSIRDKRERVSDELARLPWRVLQARYDTAVINPNNMRHWANADGLRVGKRSGFSKTYLRQWTQRRKEGAMNRSYRLDITQANPSGGLLQCFQFTCFPSCLDGDPVLLAGRNMRCNHNDRTAVSIADLVMPSFEAISSILNLLMELLLWCHGCFHCFTIFTSRRYGMNPSLRQCGQALAGMTEKTPAGAGVAAPVNGLDVRDYRVESIEELTLLATILSDRNRLGIGEISAMAAAVHNSWAFAIDDRVAVNHCKSEYLD